MRNTSIVIAAVLLLAIASCTKKKDSTPANNNNNNNTSNPYYFKFTFKGVNYNFADTVPQYNSLYPDETGGFQETSFGSFPSVGLFFYWPGGDTARDADIMGLKGRTLYFSDTMPHPVLYFSPSVTATDWYSIDTSDKNFSVKITDVKFLKKDVELAYHVSTYVITGTCNGVLSADTSKAQLTSGSFNFIISRMDL
jgi:hypothetical protein